MKKSLYILLLVCIGIVLGTLTAEMTASVPWLSWLSYGLDFGLTSPFVLDLHCLSLTLGCSIHLNIATILFLILSLLVGTKLIRFRR